MLSKNDIVNGLPKLKFVKDQLFSSCVVDKAKRSCFKTIAITRLKKQLDSLHMDLCGPMRDETPEVLIAFLKMIQHSFKAQVIIVRTDKGTELLNKTLHVYFKEERIYHQTIVARTPKQNGVVERRNRTLVKAARTMLLASKLSLFFWAEAIATACYTYNRSLIIPKYEKTAYHIINDRKPTLKHLHIFECTCYLTRDGENLDKMRKKGIRAFLWDILHSQSLRLAPQRQLTPDDNTSGLAPQLQKTSDHNHSKLKTHDCNNEPSSSKLVPNISPLADITKPSLQELDFLSSPLFKEYFAAGNQSVSKPSALFDNSQQQDTQPTVNVQPTTKPITPTTNVNAKENNTNQAEDHHQSDYRWTKNHPLEQVRGNPSKPVQTRRQLATDPKMCMFAFTVSTAEPINIKEAMADHA
ncbi:retrovirus-related pol polyprotein from transposon TNT 1-94 [Tanacetum coccineum]